MNAFQILDSKGQAIPINILDQEVCELQGKTPDPKWYCGFKNPKDYPNGENDAKYILDEMTSNWYDTLGWMIADKGYSFEDLINYYKDLMKEYLGQELEDGTVVTIEYIYPERMKLLNHWIKKGYKAKQIIQ